MCSDKGNRHDRGKHCFLLLSFTIPILIAQLLQQFYSIADAAVLGHFAQTQSLAAVGPSSLLLSVIINFFIGFTTGIGVQISHFYGKHKYDAVRKSIEAAWQLCVVVGILCTVIGLVFGRRFLEYMQTPEEIMELAVSYLKICCFGITPQMISSAGTAILRSLGNTRDPLYILGCTCAVNIILDLLLVCVCSMGIQGAAAATLLSQTLSMGLIMRKLRGLSDRCRPSFAFYFPGRERLGDLLILGIPSGMQAIFMSISSLVIQTSINHFGADAIAGMTVFAKVEGFVYYPLFSLGLALSGFIGQNDGAGNQDRIEKGKRDSLILSVGFTVIVGAFGIFFCEPLLRLFTSDPRIMVVGTQAVCWILPFYFLYAVNQVYIGCLRGCGHTVAPMMITLICYSFFRIIWCRVLLLIVDSMVIIYSSYTVSWILMAALLIGCWRWRKFSSSRSDKLLK